MNRIFKELKKQARGVLPDEQFKENLKKEILTDVKPAVEESKQKKKISANVWIKSASVAAAVLLIIAVAVGIAVPLMNTGAPTDANGNTVVLIDINPSFEIVADGNDTVSSVTGLNSDARIVLLGKNYVGGNLYDVCCDIVMTAIRLNYVHTVADMINVVAYNENADSESDVVKKINQLLSEGVDGKAQLSVLNSQQAKESLIQNIILQFGEINGLGEKTIAELHRILMNYDITKEEELDRLEDLWEEALEKEGFDDDIAEEAIEKWKEQYLKPLGEELDDEVEDYIDLYELKLIYGGMNENEAEEKAKEEYRRVIALGDRNAIRQFIDAWWIEAEEEYFALKRERLEKEGYDQEQIEKIFEQIREQFEKDAEDKKEEIFEYLEEYYED